MRSSAMEIAAGRKKKILSQNEPIDIREVKMNDVLMWQAAEETLGGMLLDESLVDVNASHCFKPDNSCITSFSSAHTFSLLISVVALN